MLINQLERRTQLAAIDSTINPSQPYHALVVKNEHSESIVNLIDTGIKQLRSSGKYQQVLDKYLKTN